MGTLIAYVDGSARPKEKRAGCGIYVEHGHPLNKSIPLVDKCAGHAERFGPKDLLETVENHPQYRGMQIIIRTDRQDLINRIYDPKPKKFKKQSKIETIHNELLEVYNRFPKGQVTFEKVPAHTGKPDGNYFADLLAGYASGKEQSLPPNVLTQAATQDVAHAIAALEATEEDASDENDA